MHSKTINSAYEIIQCLSPWKTFHILAAAYQEAKTGKCCPGLCRTDPPQTWEHPSWGQGRCDAGGCWCHSAGMCLRDTGTLTLSAFWGEFLMTCLSWYKSCLSFSLKSGWLLPWSFFQTLSFQALLSQTVTMSAALLNVLLHVLFLPFMAIKTII